MGAPRNWGNVLGVLPALCDIAQAQSATLSATSSSSAQFTMPASANEAPPVIPNIKDPQAVDAQTVCPGYTASNVQQTESGFKASLALAGPGCNVYGTDIEALNLTVEYQNTHRLHVAIVPAYIAVENAIQYIIPESVLTRPGIEQAGVILDLEFSWTNEPSFGFDVTRKSNKDFFSLLREQSSSLRTSLLSSRVSSLRTTTFMVWANRSMHSDSETTTPRPTMQLMLVLLLICM
jgi:alpha-glucosidase